VSKAEVQVADLVVSQIGKGLLIFIGIHKDDIPAKAKWLVQKILSLRLFSDDSGKMNLSVKDIQSEILVVSQFTLYGSCLNGRRPDFMQAALAPQAKELYDFFVAEMTKEIPNIATGCFGADMKVSLVNDGPFTLIIDTEEKKC